MPKPFFPDPVFAWLFVLGLIGLTSVAAWVDTRKAIVPNRLTVATLLAGLAANLIRGAWNVQVGHPSWVLPADGLFFGGLDGLLFALAGFAFGFALLFVFWVLGLCGGGDVKLFAAAGGWLGWQWFFMMWLVSLGVLFVWTAGRILFGGLAAGAVRSRMKALPRAAQDPTTKRARRTRMTYSLPIAVATAVTLLWVFRFELQLATPKPDPQPQGAARVDPPPQPA